MVGETDRYREIIATTLDDMDLGGKVDVVKGWLYRGRVSFYMTLAVIGCAVFMAQPTIASLLVMLVLTIMAFLTRFVAKLEERVKPEKWNG